MYLKLLIKTTKSIDYYTLKAIKLGLRSRAWFKLDDIQKADNILKPGMTVVELGSNPGGWSEYVLDKIGKQGSIIACDILPMDNLKGVYFIQGNCFDIATLEKIYLKTKDSKADVVISDMSPAITGIPSIDIPKTIELIKIALKIGLTILKPGGSLLVKAFQGERIANIYNKLRTIFNKVNIRTPKASHIFSREAYIVAKEIGL
ncbi:RlmE family RNA methyltransferase [Candidatus Tremblaya phenacola]|uniref:Ribosomal RNA large subunit methyltransferase E n=1 Tax=Candidatus Tremblayella phenacoccinincola TaxID=1010676 RepID=A0A2G0V7A4_9PROT|nr:SAM-dependent methyltransferase [Candidatus Tremblaya phenacola]PHN16355.1 Ribosomal RNA large subunit methyltransferase E [Candidatus Tremblaya phenacola]